MMVVNNDFVKITKGKSNSHRFSGYMFDACFRGRRKRKGLLKSFVV